MKINFSFSTSKSPKKAKKVREKKAPKPARDILLSPTVVVLATYVLLLLTKIIDVTLINRENEYFSVVVLQMMIFLLPGAVWAMFSGEKYISRLRLKPPHIRALPLVIFATLTMISGGVLLSMLFGKLGASFQSFTLYDTFISKDNGTVPVKLYLTLAYALLPAVCEEFVYRGILCCEYEHGGVLRAVVLSSVFFGMLHFDLVNLPIYIFAGAILALTMYATRSLFGSVICHFLYNLFGLFGQPYINSLYNLTGASPFFTFFIGTVFLASAALFCASAANLYRKYLYLSESAAYRMPYNGQTTSTRDSYLEVIKAPSAIACLAVYIIALIISWL